MLLFVHSSLGTMTTGAVRSVPLDWQGPVSSYKAAARTAEGVSRQPGVLEAVPAATAPFAGLEHHAPVGDIRSASGAILAVPPAYSRHIETFRFLRGSLRPGTIVLDQQLAATLQARVGDRITLTTRPGSRALAFRVGGVALVSAPDVLFQPLNPALGPAPAQPPADIALLPLKTFVHRVAALLPQVGAPGVGSAAVPGEQTGIQWQVQAQVDPHALRGSPSHALARATQIRNAVERSLPGQVQFVDNLSDALTTAAGDALYAEALYIMLAGPGAIVALGLAYLAALGTIDRDRRELALLRARGASRGQLLFLAAIESAVVAVMAGLVGGAAALVAVHFLVMGGLAVSVGAALLVLLACVLLAWAGALGARVAAGASALRSGVVAARRLVTRPTTPLWQRLYLDVVALAVSGLVYWLTARTGFSAVVNPDSNPTLSLSVYMFLAPLLLWIGTTLLVLRLRGGVLAWITARAAGRRQTPLRFLLASASRRAGALNRGLLLAGLLLAFAVELGLFTATYDRQARVDAQLTLGADVVVNAPPGVAARSGLERQIARVPGVAGTTAVDHSYAYVGPDLQDTFGVDATTLRRATSLRDSYFLGESADAMLARLQSRPDAILVSRETITDYLLGIGDLLKLRVLDRRSGRFRVAPFHVAGIVQEFPSAPRDSFMVVNARYLERVTNDPGPNVIFVRAHGDPTAVAQRVRAVTRPDGATVKDIREQSAQTVSSITTVDLAGIGRIEEAFALLLAAAALALFVSVALEERRREFAAMRALGAPVRRVAGFVWSETAIVLAAALPLAGLLGWILAEMLVAMLRHAFDPPPDTLAVPWLLLVGVALAAVGGALLACGAAARALGRLPLAAILREE